MKISPQLIIVFFSVVWLTSVTNVVAPAHSGILIPPALAFVAAIFAGLYISRLISERKSEVAAPVDEASARNKAEAEREVISEIIKGVTSTDNLDELLNLIHRSIGRILYADNCFVALYDAKTEFLDMQFFVDKYDSAPPPFQIGRGLTAYVYRTGQAMLMTPKIIDRLIALGEVEMKGTPPAIWLGVPLRTRTGIIGVLVVQHYEDHRAYSLRDLELLAAVGDQIAMAIERKRVEEALRISEEQHRLLFETNPQPAYVYDLDTMAFLAVNEAAVRHYGYSREEFLNEITIVNIRPTGHIPQFLERISTVTSESYAILAPSTHRKKDGAIIDVEITSHCLVFAGRRAQIVLVNDVTERKMAEQEAERLNTEIKTQRGRLNDILENLPCVVWEIPLDPDQEGAPAPFVNSYITKMYGYTPEEWLSTPEFWSSAIHPDDRKKLFRAQDEVRRKGEVTVQSRWVTNEGLVIWGETRIVAVRDESGRPIGLRGVTTDITERKSLEDQLTHQALHDPLTELPNRILFRDRVKHAIERCGRKRAPVAVLFLDLDNFKSVNDTLGHAVGDELLISVTERLKACLRASDTPARLGGDEFAVLVEDTEHTEGAVLIAERIRTVLSEPYLIGGTDVFIGTSIGIATTATIDESPEDLLRNADVAMYMSKSNGRNRYTVFESEMHDILIKRVQLEADLRSAIDREEFEVYYQPIIDLRSERIMGMEALVRWHHPVHGLIPPLDFISVAEDTGLIIPIGGWVLEEACRQAREWQTGYDYGEPLSITVNVSCRQLQDGGLFQTVAAALAKTGLSPQSLILEITESTMLANTDASMAKLTELKSLGIRLAIDDFGTGYSSLSYLQRFPVDILKIDKSFIDQLANSKEGSAVAKAIITMGETLNLKTIAEGIESGGQSTELQNLGCDLGQGFHFAKPLQADAMREFLRSSGASREASRHAPAGLRINGRVETCALLNGSPLQMPSSHPRQSRQLGDQTKR